MAENYNPQSLNAVVSRIEEKIDGFIEHINGLDKRVAALEAFRWKFVGAFIALQPLIGFFWYTIVKV